MRRPLALLLAVIVIAGALLRFSALSSVPVALYCDEAFHGYEAYSLLETGADSRGRPWPLFFDIFGVGWEEPLYIYLTTLPVSLLGNTESATRVVAAAAGTLSLLCVAALAFELAGAWAAIAAALLMSVSPWAFHFSRIGFQASLLPMFLAAAAAAALRGIRTSRGGWLALSALLFAGSLYTYVASRALTPLLLAGFAVVFAAPIRALGARRLAIHGLILLACAAPVALFAMSPDGQARYQDVGLVSRYAGAEAAGRFLSNYLSYLSPRFLLLSGDPNPRHSVSGFGALHPQDLIFLLAGAAAAIRARTREGIFMLWWLAIATLPACLAADPAHAVRAIGALPPLYALAGSGAAAIFGRGGRFDPARTLGRAVLAVAILLGAFFASRYLYHYYSVYPASSGPAWQFGLKEAFTEAEARAAEHDSIYVTRAEDFPFIHRLYLFGFPPAVYQARRFEGTPYLFDEPVFYRGGLIPGREHPLFILKPDEIPDGLTPRRTIFHPDGSAAFVLAW